MSNGWGWGWGTGGFIGGDYTGKVLSYSPIAYWPLNETSGTTAVDVSGNGHDATHIGVTLGQPGIGDGLTCPHFDGVSDTVDAYSASFAAAANYTELTVSVWFKVNAAAIWTDSTLRSIIDFRADNSNLIYFRRDTTNGQLAYGYYAGGAFKQGTLNGLSSTGWLHFALTVSDTADQEIAYLNGTPETPITNLTGVWAGTFPSASTTIGSYLKTQREWIGWLAHVAYFNSALSAANIAGLATV